MYPGLRVRASDAEDSDSQRSSRSAFSGLPESVRRNGQCEEPGHLSRRQSERALQTTEYDSEYSGYGSSVGWSIPSQASFSDHSLDPQDSISNRDSSMNEGSRSSSKTHITQISTPSRVCAVRGRYRDFEYYDPQCGAWVRITEPHGQGAHHDDRMDPRDLLAFYSEEPESSRNHDGDGMGTRLDAYDDDYEDPFAPRDHGDSDRESRHENRDHMDDPPDTHDFDWEEYEIDRLKATC